MTAIDITFILKSKLDQQQYNAATDTAREVLTLACAGSGKSRTLAYRIAWLLTARNAAPESIVAFTFTDKAAESVKLRLAEALDNCGLDNTIIGRIYIGTIHSYCFDLLRRIDVRYRQYEVLDDNRLKLYLMANYPTLSLRHYRTDNNLRYFQAIDRVFDAWKTMNDELILLSQVRHHDRLLADILKGLRKTMKADRFIDFSLMQRRVVEALRRRRPRASAEIARLQHLLVDEYQDVNRVQDKLVHRLHRHLTSLFIVGDDDQSIYGWRGADVTRIQEFGNVYANATRHTLARNYRSTPLIVRVSDAFAHKQLGATRIVKNPTSYMPDPPQVPNDMRVLWFDSRADEANWVVSTIRSMLGKSYVEKDGTDRGLMPADFAVLMRSTRTAEPNGGPPRHQAFTEKLILAGIDYSLEAGGGLFDRPHVNALRSTYEILRDGQPDQTIARKHFDDNISGLFPKARYRRFARTLSAWGRKIHAPVTHGAARRRILPQQMLFDLLEAFEVAETRFADAVFHDIGVFSRIMQDVETVYPSIDTTERFAEVLNFLCNAAETGYDTTSGQIVQRPNAVTVSTVHQMKGLEFPVVFLVDIENTRFPGRKRSYQGALPEYLLQEAIDRGSYQSTLEEESRLFYTALTRSERFLYITGCSRVPGGKRSLRQSSFSISLDDSDIVRDSAVPVGGLPTRPSRRRIDEGNLPTSFSDLRYYLRCPKDYQYRSVFGLSPAIPDLFGFGLTTHTSIARLHQRNPTTPPSIPGARQIAEETFHLRHVKPSLDPASRPGPFERAKKRSVDIVAQYANAFGTDFQRRRHVEEAFEIPVKGAVISGSIDLMLLEEEGEVKDACVIDFKTGERGRGTNEASDQWVDFSLQTQLYAIAARDVLKERIDLGYIHFLKDRERMEIPVSAKATDAARSIIDWAIQGILDSQFPMRPERTKCDTCDFRQICPKKPEAIQGKTPRRVYVPGAQGPSRQAVQAIERFDG